MTISAAQTITERLADGIQVRVTIHPSLLLRLQTDEERVSEYGRFVAEFQTAAALVEAAATPGRPDPEDGHLERQMSPGTEEQLAKKFTPDCASVPTLKQSGEPHWTQDRPVRKPEIGASYPLHRVAATGCFLIT